MPMGKMKAEANLICHAQHSIIQFTILNYIKHDDTGGWKVLTPQKRSQDTMQEQSNVMNLIFRCKVMHFRISKM